jgi:hypothetical protein
MGDKFDIEFKTWAVAINLLQIIKVEKIDDAADEICNWVQDAVGDMANDYQSFVDDKWTAKIKKAKRNHVTDIKGWLADEYFNDVDTLEDLCGDRIHDAATQILKSKYSTEPYHDIVFILICMEMEKRAHPALIRALNRMRMRHMESIEKWKKTMQKPTS